MDILIPFLPRINTVHPVDKSTLYVVGVSDNKTTKVRLKKNEATLSELKKQKEDTTKENHTNEDDEEHIDTWA
ncbi:hypothetical protein [Pseudoalteromonas sp. MMG024]|uniref:hypothetical protein n=1 Tax=Pseudoalteromonas sp. MMG024 TaxID=2909980 RepID=UPI001F35F163|nr:hypothetical protein [Pseudoalteromonas sp. MMG024]MCF6456590.1 hypothetical protein [Pseudoalteromonas sp. MMG024]